MNVVQVDAYEANLHGRHIRWFLPATTAQIAHYPPGFAEQVLTESPPFQKKILLCSSTTNEAWKLVDKWDFSITPTTGLDWSVVLAFLQNHTHCLVISATDVSVPPAFFQKCRTLKSQPTLICFQTLLEDTYKPLATATIPYDDTFFPQITEANIDSAQAVLQQTLNPETFKQLSLKETIRDLKSAGASLVACRSGGLYWYYMSEQASSQTLFHSVFQTLFKRS